jgi:3-isopropylmalate dehydrogenase
VGTVASDLCEYSEEEITIYIWLLNRIQNRRKKVTMADKANVLKTSRLWRRAENG